MSLESSFLPPFRAVEAELEYFRKQRSQQRWELYTSYTATWSHSIVRASPWRNMQSSLLFRGIKIEENSRASPVNWNSQVGKGEFGPRSVWVSMGSLSSLLGVETWSWLVFLSSLMMKKLVWVESCPVGARQAGGSTSQRMLSYGPLPATFCWSGILESHSSDASWLVPFLLLPSLAPIAYIQNICESLLCIGFPW